MCNIVKVYFDRSPVIIIIIIIKDIYDGAQHKVTERLTYYEPTIKKELQQKIQFKNTDQLYKSMKSRFTYSHIHYSLN